MASYTHGSSALNDKVYRKAPAPIRETAKTVRRKKHMTMQETLLYLFTIVVCVIVAVTIVSRYAQIYEVNNKLQMIENDIRALENENKSLKLEVYKLQDPKRLFEVGKSLGLLPANEDEINDISTKELSVSEQEVAYNE